MSFTPVITNEGAAYLASVIALQGNVDIKSVKFSSTNYSGSEAALTAATFLGTLKTDSSPSASVKDSTTISIATSCDNVGITVATNIYSIGIIANDSGTDVLLCVCTTTTPDVVNPFVLTASYLHYDINLAVSSTNDITVSGSIAGGLYVSDIVNGLNSDSTTQPLGASQGKVLDLAKQPKTLDTPITIGGTSQTTVETSLSALNNVKAERKDITDIIATGSTNNTGSTITNGSLFYLNGELCKAKADIAINATFTLNTNFEVTNTNKALNTIEPITANMTTGSFSGVACGKMCSAVISGGYRTTAGDWKTLGYLQDHFPAIRSIAMFAEATGSEFAVCIIETTGEIKIYCNSEHIFSDNTITYLSA